MRGLQGVEFRSHVNWEEDRFALQELPWSSQDSPEKLARQGFTSASVTKVRADPGYHVTSFPDLVRLVAQLGSCNTQMNLLFRGQNQDYKDSTGKSKLYPSIFRPDPGKSILPKITREKRFQQLDKLVERLRKTVDKLGIYSRLHVHPEYWLAILQHYDVYRTPLLDITQSLRVAATFALYDLSGSSLGREGFVYVFGFPHLHGSISKYADQAMTIVKLQSLSPPQALRPHFQEGYLVGRWPHTTTKKAEDNFAYWLSAKYRLDNSAGSFFTGEFPAIPMNALIPEKDPFRDKIREVADSM